METIKIYISRDEFVRELQEKFSSFYPYLKLNFFRIGANAKQVTNESVIFCPDAKMYDVNPQLQGRDFEITPDMTVAELESKFFEEYGLPVQVLRKTGNLWLETSESNGWTLKEQNDHGEAISPRKELPVYFSQVPFGC